MIPPDECSGDQQQAVERCSSTASLRSYVPESRSGRCLARCLLIVLLFALCAGCKSTDGRGRPTGQPTPAAASATAQNLRPVDGSTPLSTPSVPPASRQTNEDETKPVSASQVYLGVWQPGVPGDMSKLRSLEQSVGKHVAIVGWYVSWDDATRGPDLVQIAAVADHGSVPLISWQPEDGQHGTNQPAFSLTAIMAGRYDGYVRFWAQRLAEYGRPVMLRWAHEMNGDWYPWGVGVNGNTPQQYVAAWRHLRDIFAAVHATNVQWVWSPNVVIDNDLPLESLYPGDTYVDWVGLDTFNRWIWGWKSFSAIFTPTYQRILALTSRKPLMIAEVGCSENDGNLPGVSKAQWITDALTNEIPHAFPRVRAFVWFNENKTGKEVDGDDWRIESSPAAAHAFAAGVSLPVYAGYWSPPVGALPER